MVTYIRPTKGVTQSVTEDVTKQLSEIQRIILQLIEDDAFLTTNEMSQKTGVTTRTIKRDLEYLQEQKILKFEKKLDINQFKKKDDDFDIKY